MTKRPQPAEVIGAGLQEELLRLDPRSDGRCLEQRDVQAARHWFLRGPGDPRRLSPEQDPALPLAAALPDLARDGVVTILAWRPERRIVLRIDDGRGSRVLKGYRARRLAAARVRHEWARAALAEAPVRAPDLTGVNKRLAALEFEFVAGEPLDLSSAGCEAMFRVGVSLRCLQAATPWEAPEAHGARKELQLLDGLPAGLETAGVPLPSGWRALRQALDQVQPSDSVVLMPAHRDLHDGQFLSLQGELVLLDHDLLCLADPALDAANLICHVKLRELQGLAGADESSCDRCGRELLDGLDRDADPGFLSRLRFYQAATFLRLSLVYALRPPWSHLSRELQGYAGRCLNEG